MSIGWPGLCRACREVGAAESCINVSSACSCHGDAVFCLTLCNPSKDILFLNPIMMELDRSAFCASCLFPSCYHIFLVYVQAVAHSAGPLCSNPSDYATIYLVLLMMRTSSFGFPNVHHRSLCEASPQRHPPRSGGTAKSWSLHIFELTSSRQVTPQEGHVLQYPKSSLCPFVHT